MAPIPLPLFTFIAGPEGSGKTLLAQLLQKQDAQLCRISIAEPLRMALVGTYHADALFDLSFDLRGTATKNSPLPFPSRDGKDLSHREWLYQYGRFLETLHGDGILSHLAEREWQSQSFYYTRLIIDDFKRKAHYEAFIPKGAQNILTIHLSRDGTDWLPIGKTIGFGEDLFSMPGKHVAIANKTTPEDMLTKLASLLTQPILNPSLSDL